MPINPECEQFNFRSLDKLFGIQARRRGVDALENKYRERRRKTATFPSYSS